MSGCTLFCWIYRYTGGLSINYAQRCVTLAGKPVQLTSTEYEVLRELAMNTGGIITDFHGRDQDLIERDDWQG